MAGGLEPVPLIVILREGEGRVRVEISKKYTSSVTSRLVLVFDLLVI